MTELLSQMSLYFVRLAPTIPSSMVLSTTSGLKFPVPSAPEIVNTNGRNIR